MKWFVGLGNPGKKYANTRHNVGFMAIDAFAKTWGISVHQQKCQAELGEGLVNGEKVVLLKPNTYMNLSGASVRAYMDYFQARLEDMVIIYDDLDTELGKIRLRYKGSAGGHNGIRSIIQHCGTEQFKRIRIGISRPLPEMAVVDYVLSPFAKRDSPILQDALDRTVKAMESVPFEPFEKVMAQYNGKQD